MKHILYLGSQSQSRKKLLEDAQIPFILASHNADETKCDWVSSLRETVERITLYKMEHIVIPEANKEGDICFALTADTLSQSLDGSLRGKPVDKADAIDKIKISRPGATVGTAFCLDKKVYRSGKWIVSKRIKEYVEAKYEFDVPNEWMDVYLKKSYSLTASGAIAIEGYGEQFLKWVDGSYSTIVGLPMFEFREALHKLGFFDEFLKG